MGITERIVQVREAAIDPLEPSKFKHKKAPVRPPSPPVPIMHSPTRKVPHEELEQWKNLPSCTSQWKNVRSFTVSLEQRAADGRNLIEVSFFI
jgi:SNW domain-containing protein 1